MTDHKVIDPGEIHIPYQWIFEDATEREAASVLDADVNKIALQSDDHSVWILIDDTPTWEPLGGSGAGALIQRVISQDGASATGTTLIPLDDTIPQNTEGDEYLSVSITPTDSSNLLYIDVTIFVIHSVAAWISAALFKDSVANALAAITGYSTTAGGGVPLHFRHKVVAGGTSAITFKVRAGGHTAGTTTFNGNAGTRVFGGVMASSITVEEIAV